MTLSHRVWLSPMHTSRPLLPALTTRAGLLFTWFVNQLPFLNQNLLQKEIWSPRLNRDSCRLPSPRGDRKGNAVLVEENWVPCRAEPLPLEKGK